MTSSPTFETAPSRRLAAATLALALLAPGRARADASSDDPQNKLEAQPPPDAQAKAEAQAQASSQSPAAPRAAGTAPTGRASSWQSDGSWGWFVVASSVFLGGGLTSVGLAVSCNAEDAEPCQRRASMLIWSGFGVAALGSVLGLAAVARGHREPAKPAVALGFRPVTRVCSAGN